MKDKGGGVDEALEDDAAVDAANPQKKTSVTASTIESDSDSDCPELVDEEDGPILPAEIVTTNNSSNIDHTKNEDDNGGTMSSHDEPPPMTTDLTSGIKEKISPILQHEVDIFNPVQDPVKRQLMLRAKESLSAMSDAVFNSPKTGVPMKLRDNAIPIVSDVKIVDPEIRNMTAAAAFEQLDIEGGSDLFAQFRQR